MLRIKIDLNESCVLSNQKAQYIFENLCVTMGTPWTFVSSDSEESVDIYYGVRQESSSKISIKALIKSGKISEPILQKDQKLLFLDFTDGTQNPLLIIQNNNYIFNNDIIHTLFYLLTGADEKNISRNRWGQHDINHSFLYKNDLLHSPIFDNYALFIKELFTNISFVPKWKNDKKAALALSHDVDYPEMIKSIELLRYVAKHKRKSRIKTIAGIITGKESFWQFDNYMKLESSYSAKSAFYFCPLKGNLMRYFLIAPDPFYNIEKKNFKLIADKLVTAGFEVGIHTSYFAHESSKKLTDEVNKLRNNFALEKIGNRHHYWRTNHDDFSETCSFHEEAGLVYDSSLSFEKHSGFRMGTCSPFHVWNRALEKPLKIIQLPPTLMDDHLFGYFKMNKFDSYEEQIDDLLTSIINNQGVFVADFHARVLNETFYPKMGTAYEYLLKKVQDSGEFWIETPINISNHWIEREKSIRSNSKNENSSIN